MSIETRARRTVLAARARATEAQDVPDFAAFMRRAAAARRRRRAVVVSVALAALLAIVVPLFDVYRDSAGRLSPAGPGGQRFQTPNPERLVPNDQGLHAPTRGIPGTADERGRSARVAGAAEPAAGVEGAAAAPGRILFASSFDGNYSDDSINVMNADGSSRKQIALGTRPDWSPDGRRVAFARLVAECTARADVSEEFCWEIWVMNADGSGQRRLGAGVGPDWSPDGKRIAFTKPRTQGDVHWDGYVHVMNADGSQVRPLTRGESDPSSAARWSPDGTEIALIAPLGSRPRADDPRGPAGCTGLYITEVDGPGERWLTPPGCYVDSPAWSPDGRQIAFSSSRGNYTLDHGIYVARADDSSVKRLTPTWDGDQPRMALYPTWSSDGTRIAYTFDPDGDQGARGPAALYCKRMYPRETWADCRTAGPASNEIHVMNADGSASTRLTEGRYPNFSS